MVGQDMGEPPRRGGEGEEGCARKPRGGRPEQEPHLAGPGQQPQGSQPGQHAPRGAAQEKKALAALVATAVAAMWSRLGGRAAQGKRRAAQDRAGLGGQKQARVALRNWSSDLSDTRQL